MTVGSTGRTARRRPSLGDSTAKTTEPMPKAVAAPRHMGHGSSVTTRTVSALSRREPRPTGILEREKICVHEPASLCAVLVMSRRDDLATSNDDGCDGQL